MRVLIEERLLYLKHLRKMLTDVERMKESSRVRITLSKEVLREAEPQRPMNGAK
jgi:hypothetical protein